MGTPAAAINASIINACKELYRIDVKPHLNLPFVDVIPKFHKQPVGFRTIIASNKASTKPISTLVCNALKLVQRNIKKYCKVIENNTGVRSFWIVDSNLDIINTLDGLSKDKLAKSINTYDFGQMYTSLEHVDIINAMQHVLSIVFRRIQRIWVDMRLASVNYRSTTARSVDKNNLLDMIKFVIDNTYFRFGNNVYKQAIGIPMGTTCAPYIANLTLFSYEFKFISNKLKSQNSNICRDLSMTFRYIDDITVVNDNHNFDNAHKTIYPASLTLNKVNTMEHKADVLDITAVISNRTFVLSLFDKRREFPFKCNVFPPYSSSLSLACLRNVLRNERTRISRICSEIAGFSLNRIRLEEKVAERGYPAKFIKPLIRKFIHRNRGRITGKYQTSESQLFKTLNWKIADINPETN